jgi:hypothetical protein
VSGQEVTATVAYPRLIVPGAPTPLVIDASFNAPQTSVRVQLCPALMDHLDFQNWYPNPDSEIADNGGVTYEFVTNGDRFTLRIDARAQPNQWPKRVDCTLVVTADRARVEVPLRSFAIA